MSYLKGLFRHILTNQLYFVESIARDSKNPRKIVVVYSQQFDSKIIVPNINLPTGSVWIRDLSDFEEKFEKVDLPQLEKFISTSLKDCSPENDKK